MSSEKQTTPTEDTTETDKKPEIPDAKLMPPPPPKPKKEIEKQEEAKLRAKYPGLKGPGSSDFLQKRLSKGQKYFDSGDYNMAKAKKGGAAKPPIPQNQKFLLPDSTGDTIPTPDSVSHRKSSIITSKLAAGGGLS